MLLVGPLSHHNAVALRAALPWLNPAPLGLHTSAGCGDRMGLATPGHIRAARAVGGGVRMIYAQQSIREMTRTNRSPDDVMDDATWGIFQEGWRDGMGADADHLKTTGDIDACVAAGYTFYTIDPGAHVDSAADTDDEAAVRSKYAALPWPELATTANDLQAAYAGKRIDVEDRSLVLDEQMLQRAAVKYGRAVAHVAALYRHLISLRPADAVELEVSVDETDTPTSHEEHLFVARELRRLGVRWVSLAPRYVGSFEKGVDYIGDLGAFERDFAGHAAIARALGPYKLSLHTGSDKFRIYGIATRLAGGSIHLKTAGTSYLEALPRHRVARPCSLPHHPGAGDRALGDRPGQLSRLGAACEGAAPRGVGRRRSAGPAGAVRRPSGAAHRVRVGAVVACTQGPAVRRPRAKRRSVLRRARASLCSAPIPPGRSSLMRYVFSTTDTIVYRFPTHVNELVMDRSESSVTEVFVVVLEPGEAPPLHKHPDTEQVFYMVQGEGDLFVGEGGAERYRVKPGDVVRIPPDTWHRIVNDGRVDIRYVSIDAFPGARPTDEPTWEDHVKGMCVANGWDFDSVRRGRA